MEVFQALGVDKLLFPVPPKKEKENVIEDIYGVDRNTFAYLLISEIKKLKNYSKRRGYKKWIEQFDVAKKQTIEVSLLL